MNSVYLGIYSFYTKLIIKVFVKNCTPDCCNQKQLGTYNLVHFDHFCLHISFIVNKSR